MFTAMTIAGSDSGGGAGIQADLKTFSALGVYGTSAITALTAQNTVGVSGIYDVAPAFVGAQIDAVLGDIGAGAVKTGMLSNAEIIAVVVDRLLAHKVRKLVVDPVMVAKAGDHLLRATAVDALRTQLLPIAMLVTPNIPEAQVIVGHSVVTDDDVRQAAMEIHALGAANVLMKGGHREGDALDLLYAGREFHAFSVPRIATKHTHGTGCTFSAAIAAGLAKGLEMLSAVGEAKAYVTAAIAAGEPIGQGISPVRHFYRWW